MIWLCQRPPVAAQSPLLDSSYLSYQLRRAEAERCQARPRFQRHPNDQLAGLVMGVDDQLPSSRSWQQR